MLLQQVQAQVIEGGDGVEGGGGVRGKFLQGRKGVFGCFNLLPHPHQELVLQFFEGVDTHSP